MAAQKIGPLTVGDPGKVVVVPDIGFGAAGGPVTIYNGGAKPVRIQATAQSQGGQQLCSVAPVDHALAPKGTMTLPQLPSQTDLWVVIYASKRTLRDYGIYALGGALVFTGLAGYGVFDLARDIHNAVTRHRGARR